MAPPDPSYLVDGAFNDLADALDPRAFALFSEAQYRRMPRLQPASVTCSLRWTYGYSITQAKTILVPADLAYYYYPGRGHAALVPELGSSGVACHVRLDDAILAGLCEVLERDALAITWQNRLSATPLDLVGTAAGTLIQGPLAAYGASFTAYSLPTDSPFPVILAIARTRSTPYTSVGAACRPNVVDATIKALYEATQTLYQLRMRPGAPPATVREYEDHATFYATAEGQEMLEGHFPSDAARTRLVELTGKGLEGRSDDLTRAVEELGGRGLDVVYVDLTTDDVSSAGFHVVRVLVPGLVDMSGDPQYARLGASRLYDLPVQLGLRAEPWSESDIDLAPIPLA